jgi:threonine/homoserine/homoserine lactone efflux protein
MPDTPTLLSFLGISIILTIAPGPDNLMVLAHSLARGPRAGLALALGCTAGCLTHILWATLGLSAALATSPRAFSLLKFAGAAYLLWLGWQAFRADVATPTDRIAEPRRPADGRDLLRGFVANAINPKVALFFLAFLPQFVVPAAGHPGLQMLMLGLVFMAQTILIFGAIALTAGRLGGLLRRHPRLAPWLDRVAGLTFFALAIRLLTAPPLR